MAPTTACAAAPAGRQAPAHRVVERHGAAPGRRARRPPAPRRRRRRGRRRAGSAASCPTGRGATAPSAGRSRCSSTTSRSCSTRYWLLIGRPIRARGPPVDLADVVVGEVVADRLEVGAEPERPPGAGRRDPGTGPVAPPPPAGGRPAGRDRRGPRVGATPVLPSGRARAGPSMRTAGAGSGWRPRRRATSLAVSDPSASRGSRSRSGGTGWRTLAFAPPASTSTMRSDGHAPGQDGRHRPLQPGRAPHAHGVAGRRRQQGDHDKGRQGRRQEEESDGGGGQGCGEPGVSGSRPGRSGPAGVQGPRFTGTELSGGRAPTPARRPPRRRAGTARAPPRAGARAGGGAPAAPWRRRRRG